METFATLAPLADFKAAMADRFGRLWQPNKDLYIPSEPGQGKDLLVFDPVGVGYDGRIYKTAGVVTQEADVLGYSSGGAANVNLRRNRVITGIALVADPYRHDVTTASNGWDALEIFVERKPALMITDLRMPGMDGFQLIRRIREISNTHVIALTAMGGEEHTVMGFDLGADEYLVKPVSKRVFLARVRSMLRRAVSDEELTLKYEDSILMMDFRSHETQVKGESLHLRPTEFKLLAFLVQNSDRVLTHQELLDRVWGDHQGSFSVTHEPAVLDPQRLV